MKTPIKHPGHAWMKDGLCRGLDVNLFHPEEAGAVEAEAACAFCQTCPVMTECFLYAVVEGIWAGIWGGLTQRARRKLYRLLRSGTVRPEKGDVLSAREPAKCGTDAGYFKHWYANEKPCDACRAAHTEREAEYRAKKGVKPRRRPASFGGVSGAGRSTQTWMPSSDKRDQFDTTLTQGEVERARAQPVPVQVGPRKKENAARSILAQRIA